MRIRNIHFAWDNPNDDLSGKFAAYAKKAKHKPNKGFGTVYVLTGYNSTMQQNLDRIYTLRDLHFDPYVMIYNKPSAPTELKRLQRWVNSKFIFAKCRRFEDYKP